MRPETAEADSLAVAIRYVMQPRNKHVRLSEQTSRRLGRIVWCFQHAVQIPQMKQMC